MPLCIALQMDPLPHLNLRSDSTLYLARRAVWRGYRLFHYEPSRLRLVIENGTTKVLAAGHDLLFNPDADALMAKPWSLGTARTLDLATCDALLMRQDPPFDLAYITATHILDHIKDRVRIINDPSGVRDAPEKLLLTRFPHLMPPTLITRDFAAIDTFRQHYGAIVIKPLYSYGGRGVFHIAQDNDNLPALTEMLSGLNAEPWVVQQYLPVNQLGDKRIILIDGEAVGQFRRLPTEGEARSNMRVGGRTEAAPLTERDRTIITALAPTLRSMGLRLVGLDVIGNYLTEINVTSPTGLVTADTLAGRRDDEGIPEIFWRKILDEAT